jgi:hypothetical protein
MAYQAPRARAAWGRMAVVSAVVVQVQKKRKLPIAWRTAVSAWSRRSVAWGKRLGSAMSQRASRAMAEVSARGEQQEESVSGQWAASGPGRG